MARKLKVGTHNTFKIIENDEVIGTIRVKAYVQGLSSGEVYLASSAPTLPLEYDAGYAASSRAPQANASLIVQSGSERNLPDDVAKLQMEVQRLEGLVTSKEQDIMDLRGKIGK